ncbi:MAG: polysaccharide biosynthesis/export family protein [Alphaproteobacteria bacterium]
MSGLVRLIANAALAIAATLAVSGCSLFEDEPATGSAGAGDGGTVAAGTGDGGQPATTAGGPPVYLIGPGDELNIIVFGHPDLSGNFIVDQQGDLTMPLIGRLPVRGQTVDTITTDLTAAYGGSYLVDPRVSVELLNSRPFYILGQVNTPGEYPYVRGVTVRQAVAIAGGYTRRADTAEFVIYRQNETGSQEMRATADTIVLPGDTVEVQRRLF